MTAKAGNRSSGHFLQETGSVLNSVVFQRTTIERWNFVPWLLNDNEGLINFR